MEWLIRGNVWIRLRRRRNWRRYFKISGERLEAMRIREVGHVLIHFLGSILVDAFNPDQADRYDMYRRVKLKKETVRRVCHHHNLLGRLYYESLISPR